MLKKLTVLSCTTLAISGFSFYKMDNYFIKEIVSRSNIIIINEEKGVILKQEGKEDVDMTEALKNYFIQSTTQQDLIDAIAKSYNATSGIGNSEYELTYAFNLRNRKTLDKKQYDLLQNSTILAVRLIPQVAIVNKDGAIKKIEYEVIDLVAQDNRDRKLYREKINLGQDIAILMNYKPKQ